MEDKTAHVKTVKIKKIFPLGKSSSHKHEDHEIRKELQVKDDSVEEDSYLGGNDTKNEEVHSHVQNEVSNENADEPSEQKEESEEENDEESGNGEGSGNDAGNNSGAGSGSESESESESENDEMESTGVNTREIVQWKDEYIMVHDDWNGAMARIVTVKPKLAGMKKTADDDVIFFCVVKDICDIAKIKEVHYRKILNQYFETFKRRFTLDGLTLLGMPISLVSAFFLHFDAAKIDNRDSILKILKKNLFFERDDEDRGYFKKATRAKKDTEKGRSFFFVFANFYRAAQKVQKERDKETQGRRRSWC